jgi:hypothetical protein
MVYINSLRKNIGDNMFYSVDKTNARAYTTLLLDMVEDGIVDKDLLIRNLLGWMSESEVEEFSRTEGYILDDDDE